jgi:hypothetical protein
VAGRLALRRELFCFRDWSRIDTGVRALGSSCVYRRGYVLCLRERNSCYYDTSGIDCELPMFPNSIISTHRISHIDPMPFFRRMCGDLSGRPIVSILDVGRRVLATGCSGNNEERSSSAVRDIYSKYLFAVSCEHDESSASKKACECLGRAS